MVCIVYQHMCRWYALFISTCVDGMHCLSAHGYMGHLIGAAKRWDISAAYCAHTSNTSNSTNTAYHKMGHLIGAAKRWDISAAYCAHTSNTSNSTNKHSLSQDGSSDRSRQEMGHLSSILCSHKQQHLTAQTITRWVI